MKKHLESKEILNQLFNGNNLGIERLFNRDLVLKRFESIQEINDYFKTIYNLDTNFVYADMQNGLDYILISDLTQNFKVFNEEFYCYIELFYLQDKKGNYVITEVIITFE